MTPCTGRSLSIVVAVGLTMLVGCQTTTDPAEGGFLSGVANLSSGAYEKRLQEKKAGLTEAQAEQAALKQRTTALDQEGALVSAELAEAERRLARLRSDMNELNERIEEASRKQQLDETERARIEEELEDLKRAERLLSADPVIDIETKKRRIAELERRRKLLEETVTEALAAS